MNRKNKILLTLSILLLAVVVALLWTVQSFSLNASVCSALIPGRDHRPTGRAGSPLRRADVPNLPNSHYLYLRGGPGHCDQGAAGAWSSTV